MIFGLIIIGLLLIASSLKNTVNELGAQLQGDMLGQGGFVTWICAIIGLGAIGYIPEMRTTSRYLLALLIVVLVLRNGGIWSNAQKSLQMASSGGPAPSVPTQSPALSSSTNSTGSQQGSSTGGGSSAQSSGSSSASDSSDDETTQDIEMAAEIAAIALL